VHDRSPSTDLSSLLGIVGQLRGQSCWKISFINREMLLLEFGRRIHDPLPRHPEVTRGEWSLIVWSSRWALDDRPSKADRNPIIEQPGLDPEGVLNDEARVVDVAIDDSDGALVITLDGGHRLTVLPDEDAAQTEENWEDWELFTPDGGVVCFLPGRTWTFRHGPS
jgi:hypothetical protein